ncbi:hypothetical protein TNCV_2513491 [Trichonephila clavipes]|nr:hypothetical protein TNCV_2513491 [Trichonephila clavipes]
MLLYCKQNGLCFRVSDSLDERHEYRSLTTNRWVMVLDDIGWMSCTCCKMVEEVTCRWMCRFTCTDVTLAAAAPIEIAHFLIPTHFAIADAQWMCLDPGWALRRSRSIGGPPRHFGVNA